MSRALVRLACFSVLIGTLFLAQPATAGSPTGGAADATVTATEGSTIPLSFKTYRKWKIRLPDEKRAPVATGFQFGATLGQTFSVTPEGTALLIDSDGDGKTDVKAEGQDALITLVARRDGKELPYAVRLDNQSGWHYRIAGGMVGKLNGTRIQLFDQNLNGSYADFGEDAMIVGGSKVACFLSKVVNVDGELFEISVAKDGSSLTCSPYRGEAGIFNLGECRTKAKVLGAIVRSSDGTLSYDLARAKQGLRVPAGTYEVYNGEIGLGESRVKFRTGRARPVVVKPEAAISVAWGGPVKAEFAYRREADKLHLSPSAVWYYGAAGEEYYSWLPLGKSPKFTISDKKSGREIAQAYFPGTC